MATVKLDPAKGIQIPNLTTTERNAISSPETGAIIWNTTTSEINQYNGSAWEITYTPVAGITSSADATAIAIDSSEKVALGGSTAVTSDSRVAIHGGNLELTTAGSKYWIARASDGALTGSLYSPSGSVVRLSGAGTSAGTIEFEPRSSNGVIARVTGDGLCFGTDTAAANALDDYEEGSWTPQLTGANNTSHSQGRYTKIGKQVNLEGEFRCTSYSNSGSTEVTITGAPFAVGNYSNYNVTGLIQPVNGFNQANDWGFVLYCGANGSVWSIIGMSQSTGVNYDYLHRSEMSSGIVEVFFTMHYSV